MYIYINHQQTMSLLKNRPRCYAKSPTGTVRVSANTISYQLCWGDRDATHFESTVHSVNVLHCATVQYITVMLYIRWGMIMPSKQCHAVTPAQLMRPGIGRNTCAVGDFA